MFPAVYIGDIYLPSYGICAMIGAFTAFPLAVRRYRKITHNASPMIFVLLWAAVGAFLGMHLLFGITNIPRWGELFGTEDFSDLRKNFSAIFGGSVYYGGLIGGIAAGAVSVRVQRMSFDTAADCVAPAIPLFHGIARIGCFLAGCCYGKEWDHGIVFTNAPVSEANGVPRVPVQLCESAFNLITAGVLSFIFRRTARLRGRLLPLYLLIYSAGRFGLEFLRGDDYRGFLFGLSTSQLIGIAVFIASLAVLIVKTRRSSDTAQTN